ncbi:PAS domain-containing protein [Natrarchaeobius halalkaliphilus]|uniref:PAS domain-containing protein n=1 Tax=Natrarchaeobius halalkaliphilus TaxID=1679091 RepID=A0A3N6LJZ3_9EURY|nr:bacterio-opsin activator domain-containing protein [Natrarchaeobius halalkaliphilus]RQG88898.1 PAS domain-containing protein [Natrarchaeobius halalkaliphilus]
MEDIEPPNRIGGDDRGSAVAALESVVDPVVFVSDGRIEYANAAARNAFSLPDEPCGAATLASWERLERAIDETTVGTARRVELECEPDLARIHRAADGATVTFDSSDASESLSDDHALKERAINEAPVGITISDPDREDNPLVYSNDAYRDITGYEYDEVVGRNCRFLQGPDSDEKAVAEMAAAIAEDRPVTVELKNYRKDGSSFWNEVTIAPVRDERGTVTNYVGFQNDVTARKEAEHELERRTEELEYTLDRVEGLVQDVTASVAGSTSRAELERSVCERIVEESAYDGVWIGEPNPATGAIDVRTSAGNRGRTEGSPIDDGHPAVETLSDGTVVIDTVDGATTATFPLFANEIEYGVMAVRLDRDRDVDDREAVILSALARTVASGINARETSRVLETDAVVAVELELSDPALVPAVLSREADCRLEYSRSVHRTDDETASLFTATGADAETITAATDERTDASCRLLLEREDECLIELSGGDDLVGWLSERGVRVQSIDCEDGTARVTLEIPRSANVRSLVSTIENRYDRADVFSVRHRERDDETRGEFAARIEASLTDRQFAVLQRAYLGGYFEWPRPVTGEELAETLDVSRPTFHEHLRSAEAKLCRALFDDD